MNQKKVLVVSYSQTGQLTKLVTNFTKPLLEDENISANIDEYYEKYNKKIFRYNFFIKINKNYYLKQ